MSAVQLELSYDSDQTYNSVNKITGWGQWPKWTKGSWRMDVNIDLMVNFHYKSGKTKLNWNVLILKKKSGLHLSSQDYKKLKEKVKLH